MPPDLRRYPLLAFTRRSALRGLLAGLLVLVAGLALLSRAGIHVRLVPHVISPAGDEAVPVDALGNAMDDIVVRNTRAVVLNRWMDGEEKGPWQENYPGLVRIGCVGDVTGDGLDEILLYANDSQGAYADVLGPDGNRVARLGPVSDTLSARARPADVVLDPACLCPLPERSVGVVCLTSAMFGRPRGVTLYALPSAKRRWFFPMGAWPTGARIVDAGDSTRLVLVTAGSPMNHHDENGTDDEHAGVVALDLDGHCRWKTMLSGGFADVFTLALPATATRSASVVAAVANRQALNPPLSSLALLDASTGAVTRRLEFPHSLNQPQLLDAQSRTFVVGGKDHMLRVLDAELSVCSKWNAGEPVAAWGCVDLTGDGSKCVIASTPRAAVVLDGRLHVLGQLALGTDDREPAELRLARAGIGHWRACTTHGQIRLLDLDPVPPLRDPPRVAGVLGVALLAGLVAGAWRRRPRRLPSPAEAREFLVDYRQVRHDILDDVRPFGALWNWAHEAVAGAPVPLEVFAAARGEFLGIGRATLQRFIVRARTFWVEDATIERMAARLRALETLLAGPQGETIDETSARAREAARVMRELSDACSDAYREVAMRDPCRPERILLETAQVLAGPLMARGIALETTLEPAAAVPLLFDPGELRAVIGQLVDNAAAALQGRDGARIRLVLESDPLDQRRVVIRVEDNGPGIPAAAREDVFRPDVSVRAGGGFGLGHAREVARSWRGDVVVDEPASGGGASLRLVLLTLFPFEHRGNGSAP